MSTQRIFYSPIGPLLAIASDGELIQLTFKTETIDKSLVGIAPLDSPDHALLEELGKQLDQYFSGSLKEFVIPIQLRGTEFQRKVWTDLQKIPYGNCITYSQQAEYFGNSLAIRAIAAANAKNPIAIVIPCHRVIGSNGNLTGYAGGLEKKQWLLELEGTGNFQQLLF